MTAKNGQVIVPGKLPVNFQMKPLPVVGACACTVNIPGQGPTFFIVGGVPTLLHIASQVAGGMDDGTSDPVAISVRAMTLAQGLIAEFNKEQIEAAQRAQAQAQPQPPAEGRILEP